MENLSLVRGGYSLEVVPMVLDHGVLTNVLIPSFEVDGIGLFLDHGIEQGLRLYKEKIIRPRCVKWVSIGCLTK